LRGEEIIIAIVGVVPRLAKRVTVSSEQRAAEQGKSRDMATKETS
jgi:hypothetical protein